MTAAVSPEQIQPVMGSGDGSLNPTLTALSTLSLLNLRLSRLEHAITGTSKFSYEADEFDLAEKDARATIPSQLQSLESRLTNLKRLDGLAGSIVRMIDSLRREYPEVFIDSSSTIPVADNESSSVRDLSSRATRVLSHASLYTSTSSRLQTLQTMHIPPAAHSANLINVEPRLKELKLRQERLDTDIEELKRRSANIVEWWMKTGVVGVGELFEDWEARVRDAEMSVRRLERRQAEARGEVG